MRISPAARDQLAALRRHYRGKNRPEAIRNLADAMRQAARQISRSQGLRAPRPYPELAAPGRAWTHAGRYWIRYTMTKPPVIIAVFYDEADIPGRSG